VLALLVVGGGLFVMFGTSVGLNVGELDDEASAIPSVVIALALQCLYWYMLNRQVRWLDSSAA
jgi:hypothetical protein